MKRPVLLLACAPSTLAALPAPISTAVGQACGVIVGTTRFNVGSTVE